MNGEMFCRLSEGELELSRTIAGHPTKVLFKQGTFNIKVALRREGKTRIKLGAWRLLEHPVRPNPAQTELFPAEGIGPIGDKGPSIRHYLVDTKNPFRVETYLNGIRIDDLPFFSFSGDGLSIGQGIVFGDVEFEVAEAIIIDEPAEICLNPSAS